MHAGTTINISNTNKRLQCVILRNGYIHIYIYIRQRRHDTIGIGIFIAKTSAMRRAGTRAMVVFNY